jgi:hypothetical protein
MIEVTLTEEEMYHARQVAIARQTDNEAAGRETLKMASRYSDEKIHLIGAFCEVAVAKAFNHPITCERQVGPNFRSDTSRPDVGEWEIKGTERWGGRLLVPAHLQHKHRAERKYLLVWADLGLHRACLAGWAYGHEFIGREECLLSWLPRPAYCPLTLHEVTT